MVRGSLGCGCLLHSSYVPGITSHYQSPIIPVLAIFTAPLVP